MIRNIAVMAHVDTGKTTLTEQMLRHCGAIRAAGSVDAGTAHTDTLAVERRRGISVHAACVPMQWRDTKINMIDTPGHTDFSAEVERSLWALDGAVLGKWTMYRLGMKDLHELSWGAASAGEGPAFYRAKKNIEGAEDTFVNPKGWNKGHVYVNGFNLGRYWTVGPQLTLYCPGPLLKEGENEIVAFEILETKQLTMTLDDVHQISIL